MPDTLRHPDAAGSRTLIMRTLDSVSFLARPARQTRLARYFLACYLLIILIVSLYPFSGWRHLGTPVFAFFSYPFPHYYTAFENAVNVLAYLPIGFCIVLLWRRFWSGLALALLAGAVVSGSIEFTQQFLPTRIASNLDLLCNASGAWIGAMLVWPFLHPRWQRGWLAVRYQWFAPGAAIEWGLAWLFLWFVTQFDPSQPFLGVVVQAQGLPQPFESPIANPALFLRLLEGAGMMLNLLGVALFVSVLVRHARQIPRAIELTLLGALLIKLGFAGMLLKPAQFFAWLNASVIWGGLVGTLLLLLVWRLRRVYRALLGALALLAAMVVSGFWPLTTQFSALLPLFRWQYGHLQHFSGLANIIGGLWPVGAMIWLLYIALRKPVDIW